MSNKHLAEVACRFNFKTKPADKKWDISYFGLYYDKIKDSGFTVKEEKKGFQLQFTHKIDEGGQTPPNIREMESRMIFKNPTNGFAIFLGPNSISFNKVGNYENWDKFINEFVKINLEYYFELELNYEIANTQIVYLNRFNFNKNDELSEYFNLISKLENLGEEQFCQIQRNFISNNEIALIGKLTCTNEKNEKKVHLECGAVSLPSIKFDNLIDLATKAKTPIKGFFEQVITDKLKQTL